jgi:hypothetical protein
MGLGARKAGRRRKGAAAGGGIVRWWGRNQFVVTPSGCLKIHADDDQNPAYWCLSNSSKSTLASFNTLLRVPSFSSRCIGTTVPTFPSGVIFDSLTWLPDRPDIEKPNSLQRILTTLWPEVGLSPGNPRHLEGGYEGSFRHIQGEFLKV